MIARTALAEFAARLFEGDHLGRIGRVALGLVIERVEVGLAVSEHQKQHSLEAAPEPDVGQMLEEESLALTHFVNSIFLPLFFQLASYLSLPRWPHPTLPKPMSI